ncbi:hypothetical protein [Ralstonia phage RSP15]|uniref:hypothetical protein n=1 Tax=Ralstonia phage RSP15 TaxID=1785960 RepID=UPI00074D47CC|nr:hypothetical protein BH754_gp122 [Ralstonia phage RSP15]BAU40184.1 hypothetical protein [Ralstonia phage RSP15]
MPRKIEEYHLTKVERGVKVDIPEMNLKFVIRPETVENLRLALDLPDGMVMHVYNNEHEHSKIS